MSDKVVAYYRCSTRQQGLSKLGLEGQEAALQHYCRQTGSTLIKSFLEVESGRKSDRPELAKALAAAKRGKCRLVIAKLDRLSRSVAFVSALMDAGCDFVCCDMPHANRLTIHILAAVAEAEAKAISDRTKAALAAYKARGGRLGAEAGSCPIPRAARKAGAKKAGEVVSRLANEAYSDLAFVVDWRKAGMSQGEIAHGLNEASHTCRRGGKWTQGQVSRLLRRFKK